TVRRGGVVGGIVCDEYGEPAEEASVQLLQFDPASPGAVAKGVGITRTDDRGKYRLPMVLPGTYYLRASLGAPGSSSEQVFFPGRPTIVESTPVAVAAGLEAVAIDFAQDRQ